MISPSKRRIGFIFTVPQFARTSVSMYLSIIVLSLPICSAFAGEKSHTRDPLEALRVLCDYATNHPDERVAKQIANQYNSVLDQLKSYENSLDEKGQPVHIPSGIIEAKKSLISSRDLITDDLSEKEIRDVLATIKGEIGSLHYPTNYKPLVDLNNRDETQKNIVSDLQGSNSMTLRELNKKIDHLFAFDNAETRPLMIQRVITTDQINAFYVEKYLEDHLK